MSEWGIEIWAVIVSGVIGVVAVSISVAALYKSHEANVIAKEALRVQERGVDAQIESDLRSRRASLRIKPQVKRSSSGERASFAVENRGAGIADLVLFQIVDLGAQGRSPWNIPRLAQLAPGKERPIEVPLGRLLDSSNPHREHRFEITVEYSDGTGDHTLQSWVTVGPGKQFMERQITVSREEPVFDLAAFYQDQGP